MRHSQTPPRHEPKPAKSAQKLSNAAFWCPKERWTSTVQRTASLGLALEASRGTVQHASETGKPQQDSSPTSQTRSAKKLSNVTFWWPKERWNSTVQNAPPHQKPTSRQPMRHSQTPPRHEPKPAKSAQKLSNAAFWRPKERWTSTVQRTASLGLALEASRGTVQHASETGKPQQDSSPTSQTRSAKKLSNVTFWWPKERWNSTSTVQRTASLGLALEASRGTVQHASETGKPQQDSSPTSQTRSAKKLSNVTFWWPKERWNSTVQNAPPHQKPTSRQPMRNNQTPPRNEPKPAKTA